MEGVVKAAVKTQSRRQPGLVCSLLVVSLLLSAVVGGEECVQGILPAETVTMFGPSGQGLPFTFSSKLYVFPSMNFSCSGTITDIRMRMAFKPGLPADGSVTQEVFFYFLLFHDGLDSPTRRVSHILLNQNNTQQESPNEIWRNSDPLSLPVTEGTYIGFAVPEMKSPTVFSKSINSVPAAVQQVEPYLYELATNFNELEVLEVARTTDACQFRTEMFALPLIAVTFSPSNSTGLPPSTRPRPRSPAVCNTPSPTSSSPAPTSEATPSAPPTQLMTVVIAVVACLVLLVVVALVLVVVIVVVVCRRQSKDKHTFDSAGYRRGIEDNSKPVTASLFLPNAHSLDPSIDRDEGARSQQALHSPTTGQLKTDAPAEGDGITYAVPMPTIKGQESGACKVYPTYDTVYPESRLFVPTMDERAKYATTQSLAVQYARPSVKVEGSQHYDFPSTESEHYWRPANNEADLYRQLSQHKYQEFPRSSVIQDEQIGEGEFGVVCRGEWQNVSGVVQQVAIKMLHSKDNKVKFLQEAAAMGQFNHPHVARLFGVVTIGEPVMIVMELLEKGDLRSYLLSVDSSQYPDLPPLLLKFSRQVADGMAHLSSKDFIHRDLAARNILLDRQLNCKIADFGMSRDLTNEYYFSQGGRIPLKWTAPEALLYHKYSTGSDVWSYGMVLFEIWSLGHKPFEEETAEQLVEIFSSRNGYCQAPPPGCPREVYTVMVECWNPDHHKRPSFDKVSDSLSKPEPILTSFGENLDLELVPPSALVLGSPLDTAKSLYLDLQHAYKKKR